MKRKTIEEFIKEAKEKHGNDFSYEKTNYINCNTKIIVTDKYGNDLEVWPLDFLRKFKNKNEKFTTDFFINKSKEIFGNETYDYSKTVCANSHDSVIITCKKHGDFVKKAYVHLYQMQGCPFCNHKINSTEDFIKEAKKIHGEKYDYSKTIYNRYDEKVTIICKKHGEYKVLPFEHLKGKNCKKCATESLMKKTEEFIKECDLKNRNIELLEELKGVDKKHKFKCLCCGKEWIATPSKIKLGRGCPFCCKGISSTEDFIKKAEKKHGNKYTYESTEYINYNTPLKITCKKHGEFITNPYKVLYTINPCKRCSRKSKAENDVSNLLSELNIKFESNKTFKNLGLKSYDFYLSDYNIIIECQGIQHFKPINFFGGIEQYNLQHNNDIEKLNFAKNNNFKILYFSYVDEYDEFLGEKLIKSLIGLKTIIESLFS